MPSTFLATPTVPSTNALPTITTPRVLFLLFSVLICAIVDLSLSLVDNLGLPSLFIGPAAAGLTIIHILTDLFIIFIRHRLRQSGRQNPRRSSVPSGDWELLPQTSKVSSIIMDLILAALFVIACIITLLLHFINYFGGASTKANGKDESGSFDQSPSVLKGPKAILFADGATQLFCGILLSVLAGVGSVERRRFRKAMRKILMGGDRSWGVVLT